MIDLHCHSLFSDGCLVPAELIQRAEVLGYEAMAITDHADQSNAAFILDSLLPAVKALNKEHKTQTLVGVELTHLPPKQIAGMARQARKQGAQLVVVHGQSLVEPVAPGTNFAAIDAGVDILAHPGLLTLEEAQLAAKKGVFLEISARAGHSLANGLVAKLARQSGARLVLNTDAHAPGDLITQAQAIRIAQGAGLSSEEIETMFANSRKLYQKASRKR